MIGCRRGDVVLVGFMFADESGWKHRPAVVLSSAAYHSSRQELIVAAVSSNIQRLLFGDHLLVSWKEAGLLFPSVVMGILRTIKVTMIHTQVGLGYKSRYAGHRQEAGENAPVGGRFVMRFGFPIPMRGALPTLEAIHRLVRGADEYTYDSIWIGEPHLCSGRPPHASICTHPTGVLI